MNVCIGLDVGTTSIKAVAFDKQDRELSSASTPTPTTQLSGGGAQHDANELWARSCDVVRQVLDGLDEQPIGIAVASMGEAGVLIDVEGRPLAPIIAWFDDRSDPQAQWWAEHVGVEKTQRITGLTPKPAFGATKMLWTRQHLPEEWTQGWRWLNVADWITYNLTGEMTTDFSLASRTMLFDVAARSWSQELITASDIDGSLLAPLIQSGATAGTVTPAASEVTGLSAGTVVGAGGQDHVCAALALGVTEPGLLLDSIGTAEALLCVTDGFDSSGRIAGAGISQGAHVEPGRTYAMTGFLGGGRIDQQRRKLDLDWPRFLRTGEAKAVIDEVAAAGQDRVASIAAAARLDIQRQLVTGGASRINALITAKRSLTNHDLEVVAQPQATALGAAILARRASEMGSDPFDSTGV